MGTPQGSCISPLLSNLFLHYAFDHWMAKTFRTAAFVRYADDGVIQCHTKREAIQIKKALRERFKEVGLEMHSSKTNIIHCQDSSHPLCKGERVSFDFLGYTFKPRRAVSKTGSLFTGYLPAVSNKAKKAINKKIRNSGIRRSSHRSIRDLAREWNPILRGWCNYYGRYTPSALYIVLSRFNNVLTRWTRRTLKSLKGSMRRAYKWLKTFARANGELFWHWKQVPP